MKKQYDVKELIWIDRIRKGKKLTQQAELDMLDMEISQLETNQRTWKEVKNDKFSYMQGL